MSGWEQAELFEMGMSFGVSDQAIIGAAAEDILRRELTMVDWQIPFRIPRARHEVYTSYPKLVRAANAIVKHEGSTNETKAKSLVLIGFLKFQANYSPQHETLQHFIDAVTLSPRDWRVHSMLANQYMNRGYSKLAYGSLCDAGALTNQDIVKLDLYIRKAKTLFALNPFSTDVIDAFKAALEMYYGGLNRHPQMNDRFVGKLAVAEFQLVQCLVFRGRLQEACKHFKDAERKRKSIHHSVADTIDWSNQTMAQITIWLLPAVLLSFIIQKLIK